MTPPFTGENVVKGGEGGELGGSNHIMRGGSP